MHQRAEALVAAVGVVHIGGGNAIDCFGSCTPQFVVNHGGKLGTGIGLRAELTKRIVLIRGGAGIGVDQLCLPAFAIILYAI
jgi:hypothetical protein